MSSEAKIREQTAFSSPKKKKLLLAKFTRLYRDEIVPNPHWYTICTPRHHGCLHQQLSAVLICRICTPNELSAVGRHGPVCPTTKWPQFLPV